MVKRKVFYRFFSILLIIKYSNANPDYYDSLEEDQLSINEHNIKVSENRLAAQLFSAIEHFKNEDPVGFPGAPIPDPMDVPDIKKSLGLSTLYMKNVKAHGLSKFRIKFINTDLKALEVNGGIQLDEMNVKGTYILNSFISKAEGPFSVILKNVFVAANASLSVSRDGKLSTDNIHMDITFSDMSMEFQNLGFLGTVFQGIVNSAPTLVFDGMKPFMLKEADTKIREEINTNIEKLTGNYLFPNSIAPLDMAIADARKKVQSMGFDPYHLPSYNRTVGVFSIQMSNTWITGVSSFYRVGQMAINMVNNTIIIGLQIGTQKIQGGAQWEVGVGMGMITRIGHTQFTVQHIKLSIEISQSLDTRKKPKIRDLQIDLGNIQVRCDGAGTIDYIMEFAVNILPNILRYQIMDAIENPIKMRIQEKFNQIDVERAIKENYHKFETMGTNFSFDFIV